MYAAHHLNLHQEVQRGQRQAIAWGISGHIHYLLLQAPYPYQAIIDGTGARVGESIDGIPVVSPDYLATCQPEHTLLVIFADVQRYGQEIVAQISRYGAFPWSLPVVSAQLWDASGHQATPPEVPLHRAAPYRVQSKHAMLFIHRLATGGAERQMMLLACGLRQLAWQVTLVCAGSDCPSVADWSKQLAEQGVKRLYLGDPRRLWQEMPPDAAEKQWLMALGGMVRARGLHNLLALSRIIKTQKPEILISYLDDCNLMASMAGLYAGCQQILLSGRSLAPSELKQTAIEDHHIVPDSLLKPTFQRLLQDPAVSFFTNSQAGALSYQHWLSLPTTPPRVSNAIHLPKTDPTFNLRETYGLGNRGPIVVSAMRLSVEKGPFVFVEIIDRLRQHYPDIIGLLLGDGPLKEALQRMVEQKALGNHLILTGKVSHPQDFFRQADLYISPSAVEGLPNTVVEAQLMGCPVVATDVGGTREAMFAGLEDRLVKPQTDALLQATAEALSDIGRLKQICQRQGQSMIDLHTPKQLAISTLALAGK